MALKGIKALTTAKVNVKYVSYKLRVKSGVCLRSKACHPAYTAPAESSREPVDSKTQLRFAKLRAGRDFKQSSPHPGPQAVQHGPNHKCPAGLTSLQGAGLSSAMGVLG